MMCGRLHGIWGSWRGIELLTRVDEQEGHRDDDRFSWLDWEDKRHGRVEIERKKVM